MFIIYKIQKWMDTMAGQTFMQYAYSWGAAIVILGTLFKLTHLPGANVMLFVGMGTEVLVFVLSGFERVTEKTEEHAAPVNENVGVTVTGGSVTNVSVDADALARLGELSKGVANAQSASAVQVPEVGSTQTLLQGWKGVDPSVADDALKNYTDVIVELTEAFAKVKSQAERITTDSAEMENLNRTLTGIATVYELQLRNISKQVGTIEHIDEQTRKMAEQIEELNKVYARMIQALTVNMGSVQPQVPGTEK